MALITGMKHRLPFQSVFFSSVFDTVQQNFADRSQDFQKNCKVRLVAFLHLIKTKNPLDLQVELMELNKMEQLETKFKHEEHLLDTLKSKPKSSNKKKTSSIFSNLS